jgi:beta-lactamase regulating signal transducer with metallopeptidase domain
MIGQWILYQSTVALLLGFAALAGEQLLGARRLPRRGVWMATLVASIALPALVTRTERHPQLDLPAIASAALSSLSAPQTRSAVKPPSDVPIENSSLPSSAAMQPRQAGRAALLLRRLELSLKWIWLGLSVGTFVVYGCAALTLARAARHWRRQNVDGSHVRIARTVGPAVFGYLHPEIVLPQWLLTAPPSERALVLAHEREHVLARDPLLRLAALLLLATVPWSIPLWWQLWRMRCAIEVDCDARVLAAGAELEEYGNALIAVCRRRIHMPLGSMSMSARASSLERRLLIMTAPEPKRLGKFVLGALALSTSCLAAAFALPPPSQVIDAIVEPAPISTVPFFTAKAETAARAAYPTFFEGHLPGTELIAVDLNIEGQVIGIANTEFPPGPLSANQMSIDPEIELHDIYRAAGARGLKFYGWFGTQHSFGLYISYRVLMWPHDASRAGARVRAAVAARFPEYFRAYPAGDASKSAQVIFVFMNDDGTIARASAPETVSNTIAFGLDDRQGYKGLLSLGLSAEQFGRRGATSNWQSAADRLTNPNAAPLTIYYAWPRRADDPPDQLALLPAMLKRFSYSAPSQKQYDSPDQALLERYFPEVWRRGPDSRNEVLWVLLDRSGTVWGTGISPEMVTVSPEIQALYPGITLGDGRARLVRTAPGTPVMVGLWWLGEDSRVTERSAIDFAKRDDVLVIAQISRNGENWGSIATSLKFGAGRTANFGDAQFQIKAISAGHNAIELQVATEPGIGVNQPVADTWTSPFATVAYGHRISIDLPDRNGQRWRVELRPEDLHPGERLRAN